MVDFSNLKKADVKETAVAKFELSMLEGDMHLMLAPATDANKPYFNALLRRNKKAMRQGIKQITVAVIEDNRAIDRELYAEHIIKGWSVKDASGSAVPLSKENALDFLTQLPNHVVDDIRKFAADVSNFTNESIDVEDEVKN